MPPPPTDPTEVLISYGAGDARAADQLFPFVYEELRRVAKRLLATAKPSQTLQPTALVHEVYLRLVDQDRVTWKDRAHFLAVAAMVLRRVLVDHARSRGRLKRGGQERRESMARLEACAAEVTDYADLDDALRRLATGQERAARVVELRFFGGLSISETAHVLGVSNPTVERDWRFARAWLHNELGRH